jgi:hypothetical protein
MLNDPRSPEVGEVVRTTRRRTYPRVSKGNHRHDVLSRPLQLEWDLICAKLLALELDVTLPA